jgi:proteic killer suppression protein
MRIRNVIHKGLRRFVEEDDSSGIPAATVNKVRAIVSYLQYMRSESELRAVRNWNAHKLSGPRNGTWSLSVTRNWRITFLIDRDEIEIVDLDYEDYH